MRQGTGGGHVSRGSLLRNPKSAPSFEPASGMIIVLCLQTSVDQLQGVSAFLITCSCVGDKFNEPVVSPSAGRARASPWW